MDFPIIDLLDDELSQQWLLKYFYPDGLKCPHCGQGLDQAREFRHTQTSQLTVYRCTACQGIYNLIAGPSLKGGIFVRPKRCCCCGGWSKATPAPK